jgi:hypothetical protein
MLCFRKLSAGNTVMNKLCTGIIAALALASSPSFADHTPAPREVVVKLPSLSDVEKGCIEQLRSNWSKQDNYDDTFKKMTLDTVYHRKEGQGNVITFVGTSYNEFMQADRTTTVTCRITEKPPYAVSFSIDR